MPNNNLTGFFGKLPDHGDFIYRDLPPDFMSVWDQWLQGYVGSSREQLGDAWLDIYMTSPIWRFAFMDGVVDSHAWAGIVLPSVDRVGRYFPFSVATKLPPKVNPVEFLCVRPNWYQAMEDAAVAALQGELKLDDLVEELNDSNPMQKSAYTRAGRIDAPGKMHVEAVSQDHSPSTVLPFMLDACLTSALNSYSIWSTKGSNCVKPCVFTSKGLPALTGIAAMLDGNWSGWNWQLPYVLPQ